MASAVPVSISLSPNSTSPSSSSSTSTSASSSAPTSITMKTQQPRRTKRKASSNLPLVVSSLPPPPPPLSKSRYFLSALGEQFITLSLIIYGLGISLVEPHHSAFIERDPSLSQPVPINDTVPSSQLIYFAFVLPLLSLIFLTALKAALVRWWWNKRSTTIITNTSATKQFMYSTMWTIWWLFVVLCQAQGVSLAATDTIKNVVGRQRPGFFDLVNYAGYTEAITSGDFTNYNAATIAGTRGSLSKATVADPHEIQDAQRSFPSGHASLSFAGMTFLVGFLRWLLNVPKGKWFTPTAFISCCPLILSAYIAISRINDNKHRDIDVTVGALIGMAGGIMAWQQYETEAEVRNELFSPRSPSATTEISAVAVDEDENEEENGEDMYVGGRGGGKRADDDIEGGKERYSDTENTSKKTPPSPHQILVVTTSSSKNKQTVTEWNGR